MDRSGLYPPQEERRWKWLVVGIILNRLAREKHIQCVGSSDISLHHAFERVALLF